MKKKKDSSMKKHGCLFCPERFDTIKGVAIHVTKIHDRECLLQSECQEEDKNKLTE